jgi:hypothetical protein
MNKMRFMNYGNIGVLRAMRGALKYLSNSYSNRLFVVQKEFELSCQTSQLRKMLKEFLV